MDSNNRLAAALAALMMAAGIDAASAVEAPGETLAAAQQRIEATSSLSSLQSELAGLQLKEPDSPLVALLMGRIVKLSGPIVGRDDRWALDISSPY